jgi:hypothetical protein
MRVYDCFTFFNEVELLEIRLEELAPVVDTFVIAEAPITFQGREKPLCFQDNRSKFRKYEKKIRHIVVGDAPSGRNPWAREHFQRNSLKRGMADAEPDDIVIISDADEICKRSTIAALKDRRAFSFIELRFFAYFLNCEVTSGPTVPWIKVYAAPWRDIQTMPNLTAPRDGPPNYLRSVGLGELWTNLIEDGGWHFSWLGDADHILTKLDSFSHTEAHIQKWKDRKLLTDAIAGRLYFPTGDRLIVQPVDESFPIAIRSRQTRLFRKQFLAPTHRQPSFLNRIRNLLPLP